ncbi:hypothetical protein [Deinococcus hohokamensis]|uniref:Uncharacterized protein n=1 Tax=Deinococcus hohokamensis TaxID=309883 RepID=A0ABV9I5Y7_9DEIO
MYTPGPSLLVIVPGDWDVVPEGLAELKRYLADEYGAHLLIRSGTAPMHAPLPLYLGIWDASDLRVSRIDVSHLLPHAFSTLAWMEEVM